MSNDQFILDWVELSTGDRYYGVIDFCTDRFIHFFNFTDEENKDAVLAAILWRTTYSHLRFSVFMSTTFPGMDIPKVNLVNRRGVVGLNSVRYADEDVIKKKKSPKPIE